MSYKMFHRFDISSQLGNCLLWSKQWFLQSASRWIPSSIFQLGFHVTITSMFRCLQNKTTKGQWVRRSLQLQWKTFGWLWDKSFGIWLLTHYYWHCLPMCVTKQSITACFWTVSLWFWKVMCKLQRTCESPIFFPHEGPQQMFFVWNGDLFF